MRIFISSVKAGLEEERRALPGLIQAVGHEPVTFETFGARTEPSRQECLEGVQGSDVYVLLLGPSYGFTFPETGQSATHDEYVAAQTAGIPRLVFHKSGIEPEPAQAEFIRLVGSYSAGSFWADYADTTELQSLVAKAVLDLAAAPSPLAFERLPSPPAVDWKDAWDAGGQRNGRRGETTFAELHVLPLDGGDRSVRQMGELSNPLISKLRTYGVLPQAAGVDVDDTADAVTISVPAEQRRGFHESTQRQFGGVRVSKTGQVSAWTTLPRDGLGAIVDPDDLIDTFTEQLRVIGALNVLNGARYAIAVGLGGYMSMVSIAKAGVSRSSASMGLGSDQPVRVVPDESVTAAAFDTGATEVARGLAQSVMADLRR